MILLAAVRSVGTGRASERASERGFGPGDSVGGLKIWSNGQQQQQHEEMADMNPLPASFPSASTCLLASRTCTTLTVNLARSSSMD